MNHSLRGSGWAGPSIVDLDDDGVPEVLRGGIVLSHEGVLINVTVYPNVYCGVLF